MMSSLSEHIDKRIPYSSSIEIVRCDVELQKTGTTSRIKARGYKNSANLGAVVSLPWYNYVIHLSRLVCANQGSQGICFAHAKH